MLGRVKSFPVQLHFRGLPQGKRGAVWALVVFTCLCVLLLHLSQERDVPPAQCGEAAQGDVLHIGCPRYTVVSRLVFASYGTPQGDCHTGLSRGQCHLATTEADVALACVGKQTCRILAQGGGGLPPPEPGTGGDVRPAWLSADPCPDISAKRLVVNVECTAGADYNTDPDFVQTSSRSWLLAAEQAAMKRKQWQSRIDLLHSFPHGRFAGRGAVIVVEAGGRDFALTLTTVKLLRRFGFTLPIQVWHRGAVDLPDVQKRDLVPYHVDTRDFEDFVGASDAEAEGIPSALFGTRRSQALAMVHTDLLEVLLIRPGSFPLRDPTFLFDSSEYKQTGAVFWPGLWKVAVGNPVWQAVGADGATAGWELDGGWVLVKKTPQTWPAVTLASIFTGPYYAQLLDGDKDVFRLAWLGLKLPFHMMEPRAALVGTFKDQYGAQPSTSFCGHATLHYGVDRRPLWLRTELRHKRMLERGANFRYLKGPRPEDGTQEVPLRAERVGSIHGPNGTVNCLDFECAPAEGGLCDRVAVSPDLERFENILFDTLETIPMDMREEIKGAPWSSSFWIFVVVLPMVACGLWATATSAFSDGEAREHSLVRGMEVLVGMASLRLRYAARQALGWGVNNPRVTCVAMGGLILYLVWSSFGGDDREKIYSQLTGYQRPVPRMRRERSGSYASDCAPCVAGQHCMPRRVHITYGTHILKHHLLLEDALRDRYTFHYYNDTEASEYMRTRCPDYADAYDCVLPGAYKSDIFRYCVLLNDGGIYLDNDLVLLVKPEDIYNETCPGVYVLPEYALNSGLDVRIWTGMIISSSKEPIWQCMLDEININVDNHYYGGNPVDVTGPGLLSMCFHRYPDRIKEFGYNRRDSTIWLYAENNHGVPMQIAYEVNFGDKGMFCVKARSTRTHTTVRISLSTSRCRMTLNSRIRCV
eukprot:m.39159 g.39159  ORF g.39159 m.39159 type:complete len:926 (-) comp5763_c0_seq1:190-2967(-)